MKSKNVLYFSETLCLGVFRVAEYKSMNLEIHFFDSIWYTVYN